MATKINISMKPNSLIDSVATISLKIVAHGKRKAISRSNRMKRMAIR